MAVFWLFLLIAGKGYLIEEIYYVIQAVLHWLDGYLALFTIVSIKPLFPELYKQQNEETVNENKRYRIK